jgi:hypothetical protein
LTESRKKDEKREFPKNKLKKIESLIKKYFTSKDKISKKRVDNDFDNVEKTEIDELIDSDGTMLSSRVPFLDMTLHPKKTMDQTVVAARTSNDPVTRGYRVYWGEGEDEKDNVVSEIDYSDAFGYEETENKDFKDTVKTLKHMGVDNAVERAKQFGKLPKQKRRKGKLKQRLVEKDSLEEEQKKQMKKMVEDILTKKYKEKSDVLNKDEDDAVSKILIRNLKSIKKIAEKEGVSINKLVNILKSYE